MANDTAAKRAPKKAAPAKAVKKAAVAKKAPPRRAAPLPPAGWYPDPAAPEVERYWDGNGWDARKGQRRTGAAEQEAPAGDPAAESDDGGPPGSAGAITFRGRVMSFRRPSPEQLAVWKMVAERSQSLARDMATPKPCPSCKGSGCDDCLNTGSAHTTTIFKLFNRAMTIITSVLVDEADKDWLEDELIAGTLDIEAAAQIVNLTVEALVASKAAAAPRNGPAPKARRRR